MYHKSFTKIGRKPKRMKERRSTGVSNRLSTVQKKKRSHRLRSELNDKKSSYPKAILKWMDDVKQGYDIDWDWDIAIHIFNNATSWSNDLMQRRVRELNRSRRRNERAYSNTSIETSLYSNAFVAYANKELEKMILQPLRSALDPEDVRIVLFKLLMIVPHLDMLAWFTYVIGGYVEHITSELMFWIGKFMFDSQHYVHIETFEPYSSTTDPVREISEFWSAKMRLFNTGMRYKMPLNRETRGTSINRGLRLESTSVYQNYIVLFNCSIKSLTWWTTPLRNRSNMMDEDVANGVRRNAKNMYWFLYLDVILAITVNRYLKSILPNVYPDRKWNEPPSRSRKVSWNRFINEIGDYKSGENAFVDTFLESMIYAQPIKTKDDENEQEIFVTEFEMYEMIGDSLGNFVEIIKEKGSFRIPHSLGL